MKRRPIAAAALEFRDGTPWAADFADIYHAPDGAAEVQRVFIEPAGLTRRTQPALTVAELGFGTALNFVVTAAALPTWQHLHFISFEARPIAPHDFAALSASRSRAWPLYDELNRSYPPLLPGWHQRRFAGGRIVLSLFTGDVADGLAELAGSQRVGVDAWFLDGFAPDRNPRMWRADLLGQLGGLCATGATVTTFTAAGRVRRALQSAGFAMRRVDQRPHKRETLAGLFTGRGAQFTPPPSVRVVGAGIAGCSVARHLAEAGVTVQLLDAAPHAAAGASAIPASVLHGRLLGDGTAQADWRAHAYLYGARYVESVAGPATTPGALQLPGPNADPTRLARIARNYAGSGTWLRRLEAGEASERAGWPVSGGLWFAQSRTVALADLCRALIRHPAITLETRARLPDGAGPQTPPTVLCCAEAVRGFAGCAHLELAAIAGQVDLVRLADAPPRVPVVGNGYLVPGGQAGLAYVGATFEYRRWPPGTATAVNLRQLDARAYQWLRRFRAVRCVASDRTPLVGAVPDTNYLVSTGHGSMGATTAHLAAALICSRLTGSVAPATAALRALLDPARFRARQARRGVRHGVPVG